MITKEDIQRKIRISDKDAQEIVGKSDIHHIEQIENGKIHLSVVDFPLSEEDKKKHKDLWERFGEIIEEGRVVVLRDGHKIVRIFTTPHRSNNLDRYLKYKDIVVKQRVLDIIIKKYANDHVKKTCKRSVIKEQAQKNHKKNKGKKV